MLIVKQRGVNVRVKLGKQDKIFNVPDMRRYALYSQNESMMLFGKPEKRDNARMVVGIGIVCKVQKGDTMDIVKMNFGRHYARTIYVQHNQARRQIYTLKRGQPAWFYGFMQIYTENKQVKASFFARGFQAWYVPKMLDIKNYDSDTMEELTQENESDMLNFLDDIIKGD